MVRATLATLAMSMARSFGQALGCEIVVECSEHSIELSMEVPGQTELAWDSDLYRRGIMRYSGYANPFKPVIDQRDERGEHDKMDVEEGEPAAEDDTPGGESPEIGMMPSSRYRQYLDQHLISELVRPEDRWKLMIYGLLGIGVLQFVTMIIIMYATG